MEKYKVSILMYWLLVLKLISLLIVKNDRGPRPWEDSKKMQEEQRNKSD
jgi:hypothetical protein